MFMLFLMQKVHILRILRIFCACTFKKYIPPLSFMSMIVYYFLKR